MSSEKKFKSEKRQADIVIIGGGGSGMAAALSAAEKGCSNIIVLEKHGIGGNSAMAHDVFAAESPIQKRMGVDARRDDFFKIAMRWANWSKINPRIIRAFVDKSGDTIRWLQEKGLEFELKQYYINQSPRVMHTIEGEGVRLMKVLAEKCEEQGIPVLKRTRGKNISRLDNHAKLSVLAMSKESEITIDTNSVIITTGGYAENKELLKKHCSYYNADTMLNHGVRGNTGDGISMATEIGAATAGLGHVMFHGPSAPSSPATHMSIGFTDTDMKKYPLSILIREPQTIWINKRGQRFIDEGHVIAAFASATTVAQQPDGVMYTVFDDAILQKMEAEGLNWPGSYGGDNRKNPRHKRPLAGMPLPGLSRELLLQVEKNDRLKIADSLDDIAEWIGANPAILKKTVRQYNEGCATHHDSIFCKDRKYLEPILKPPFYAIRGQSFICDTTGGIKINESMEVLDSEDNSIPGLYAAGSTTGCWETEVYCYKLTGHMLGFALNSGRIAGENAARYVSEIKSCLD